MNSEQMITLGLVVLIACIAALPKWFFWIVRMISREVGRGLTEGQQNRRD